MPRYYVTISLEIEAPTAAIAALSAVDEIRDAPGVIASVESADRIAWIDTEDGSLVKSETR